MTTDSARPVRLLVLGFACAVWCVTGSASAAEIESYQSGRNTVTIRSYELRDLTDLTLPANFLAERWDTSEEIRWDISAALAMMSEQVYSDDNETLDYLIRGMGFSRWVSIRNETMAGHVLTGGKTTVVIFRGTEFTSLGDWMTNFGVGFINTKNGRFHRGFKNAYCLVREDVLRFARESNTEHLWVTGHSLGGAMAVICAIDLKTKQGYDPTIVTFGQPRIGDSKAAMAIDRTFDGRYARFVRGIDLVPRLPPHLRRTFPYAHAGTLIAIHEGKVDVAESTLSQPTAAISYRGNGRRVGADIVPVVYQPTIEPPPLTHAEHDVLRSEELAIRDCRPQASLNAVPVESLGWLIPASVSDHFIAGYVRVIRSYRDPQSATRLPGP